MRTEWDEERKALSSVLGHREGLNRIVSTVGWDGLLIVRDHQRKAVAVRDTFPRLANQMWLPLAFQLTGRSRRQTILKMHGRPVVVKR
jgi:hypothetical protein